MPRTRTPPTALERSVMSYRTGREAESVAAEYLQRAGLEIVDTNFRCRGGEIDIIAFDGTYIAFVEVRLRTSQRFGGAIQSITVAKQRALTRAARYYLSGRPALQSKRCRFDVVSVSKRNYRYQCDWIKDVFQSPAS